MCARGYSNMCAGMHVLRLCVCVSYGGLIDSGNWPSRWATTEKVSVSVSVWPFEGTVKVIEEASLWFRHCVNYKSQSCRVCRAEGREMFSESVKGLLKSLTNTLAFITVVTSTIFLFFPSLSPTLYWSHVQSHMQGCISLSGKIIMIHHAELRH